jgi:hypothetical protein
MVKRKRSVVLAGAVAGVLGLTVWTERSALGSTISWSGAVSNTFGFAGNWVGDVAPGSGDIAYFPSTTTAAVPYTPDFDGADSVDGFQIYNNTGSGGLVWSLPRDGSANPRTITIGSLGIYLTGGGTTSWGAVNTTLAANQTWFVDANTTLAFVTGDNISGTANLDKTGTGTVILPNASETGFSGNVTIDGGVLINNRSGTGTGTGSLIVDSAGTYLVSAANAAVPAGYILNGGGAMEATGGGSTSGTYAGLGTGGALIVSNSDATVYLGTLLSTDFFTINPAIVGGDGTGTIAITGTGTVQPIATYAATNGYNGAWNVNSGGTLRSYTVDSLGDHSTTGTTTNDAAPNPIYLGNGSVDFAGTGLTSAHPNFNNPITMIGNGTIAVDEDSAASAYAYYSYPSRTLGNLAIGNNTLNVTYTANVTGVLNNDGYPVNFYVPTMNITAATPTINVVEPSTIGTELLIGTITQGVAGVGFIKTGPGDVSISGSNASFNGPITLEGGFIKVDAVGASNALGTSTITMSPGTKVFFNDGASSTYYTSFNPAGTGIVSSDNTNGTALGFAGSNISPGTSAGAGIITLPDTTSLAKSSSNTPGTVTIGVFGTNGVAGTDFSQIDATQGSSTALSGLNYFNLVVNIAPGLTGTLPTMAIISDSGVTSNSAFANLAAGVADTADAGYTYHYTDVSGAVDLTVTATPEPASSMLALIGISSLGLRRRSRRCKKG